MKILKNLNGLKHCGCVYVVSGLHSGPSCLVFLLFLLLYTHICYNPPTIHIHLHSHQSNGRGTFDFSHMEATAGAAQSCR